MIHQIAVTLTTAADGSATIYAGKKVTGRILAIVFAFGDLANTLDLTITGETTGLEVLSYANVPAANDTFHPRILARKHTDGAIFTDTASEPPFVFNERIKIVAAQGGNVKTGTLTFYYEADVSAA